MSTTVPDGGPGMQYADPEGRPSPMVEAVLRLLDTTTVTNTDLQALRDRLDSQIAETHESWCTEHDNDEGRSTCVSRTVKAGDCLDMWLYRDQGKPVEISFDAFGSAGFEDCVLTAKQIRPLAAVAGVDPAGFASAMAELVALHEGTGR